MEVKLHFAARLVPEADGMAYVERGPLVFALPLAAKHYPWEYESHGVTRKAPYCDWIILSEQDWGYAFAEKDFQLVENPLGDQPFSREEPPLQLVTRHEPDRMGHLSRSARRMRGKAGKSGTYRDGKRCGCSPTDALRSA